MGLARPYFDRNHFKEWTHDQLVTALIEAKTRLMESTADLSETKQRLEAAEPYYATGQPMPYHPGDGAWEGD